MELLSWHATHDDDSSWSSVQTYKIHHAIKHLIEAPNSVTWVLINLNWSYVVNDVNRIKAWKTEHSNYDFIKFKCDYLTVYNIIYQYIIGMINFSNLP